MTEIFIALVGLACLLAIADFRAGLLALIILDVVRDPVRKLHSVESLGIPPQSVVITLLPNLVWPALFLGAVARHGGRVMSTIESVASIKSAFVLMMLATVPAAAVSSLTYVGGYKIAALGMAFFIAPFLALALGAVYIRREEDFWTLLKVYVGVNAVFLLSAVAEYRGVSSGALGGIQVEWIRYRDGFTVPLICGIYRSPDILGLHAAHTIMFSILLALHGKRSQRPLWMLCLLIGVGALLLCGRRKMIGVPVAFLVSLFVIQQQMGMLKKSRLVSGILVVGLIVGVAGLAIWQQEGDDRYTDYASTLVSREAFDRGAASFWSIPMTTLQQAGVLGKGLGAAAQGNYYAGVKGSWQEDGIGKIIVELGLLGTFLAAVSGIIMLRGLFQRVRNSLPVPGVTLIVSGIMAVAFANFASFIVSHQAYSGDPVILGLIGLLIGVVVSAPQRMPNAAPATPFPQPTRQRLVGHRPPAG